MTRAPAIGWTMLVGAALAASAGSLPIQLGFAILAIGVLGMAHGASDLAIVAPDRRPLFLFLYISVSLICLMWWTGYPQIALPLFLAASAIHFGVEDAPRGAPLERTARGISLVATPVILHREGYGDILAFAAGHDISTTMLFLLTVAGVGATALVLIMAARRRDGRLLIGTGALLVLPPLVGFSIGFLVLHALPQTDLRRQAIGCVSHRAYLRAVGPILLAALLIAATVGAFFVYREGTGVRALFAGIAALAMPHLLVTPWFEGRAGRPVAHPCPAIGGRAQHPQT